jgi:hypothetical protein
MEALLMIRSSVVTRRVWQAAGVATAIALLPSAPRAVSGVPIPVPFYSRPDSEFQIANTYYVAANEPGASNTNNGRYPTSRGGKNGPFRD